MVSLELDSLKELTRFSSEDSNRQMASGTRLFRSKDSVQKWKQSGQVISEITPSRPNYHCIAQAVIACQMVLVGLHIILQPGQHFSTGRVSSARLIFSRSRVSLPTAGEAEGIPVAERRSEHRSGRAVHRGRECLSCARRSPSASLRRDVA